MIGQTVDGKYQIVRQLGEGGMGAVYEAQHLGTGRRVALKVILGQHAAPDAFERFQREAKAAGSIDTQHIVQVLDTGVDGYPYMVMEFLNGEDIDHLVKRVGPLPPELALRLTAQACLGLQKAHEANVVHRDIKPANLFLHRRDQGELIVKVLDFGIAKVKSNQLEASGESKGLTRTGSMLGSPLYMSPEQAKGLKTIDHRTDLWSLGCVLYEAFAGKTPHHDVETLGQLIIAICAQKPRPIQDIAPWVPPEYAEVVHRAMRLDPNERFQTAGEMFDAIRRLLPGGWSVHESMLVPLPPQQRAIAAARFVTTAPPGMSSSIITTGGQGASPMAATTTSGMAAAPSNTLNHTGSAATTQTVESKRAGAIVAAAAAVVLAGGLATGGYFVLKSGKLAQHASATAEPASAVAPPASSAPPAPPVPVVPTVAVPEKRVVHVAILPPAAVVEVDGEAAARKGDGIDLEGPLGSVHRVHVHAGARESTQTVIITENGPTPDRIELAAPGRSNKPASQPAASAAPAAGPKAATAAPAKPKEQIDKNFE